MQRLAILAYGFAVMSAAILRSAASADAMLSTTVDCPSASTMMAKATPSTSMMSMSKMTLDQQYVAAMVAHNKAVMTLSNIEAQCGKDPKTKAMAKTMLHDAMKMAPDLDDLTRHSS